MIADVFWLDEQQQLTLAELARLADMTEDELRAWVEEGVLTPIDPCVQPWRFGADRLSILRRICRLRRDFDLDLQALALVVRLLERIEDLEDEVGRLKARLPRVLR